jgi:hypothetical protein
VVSISILPSPGAVYLTKLQQSRRQAPHKQSAHTVLMTMSVRSSCCGACPIHSRTSAATRAAISSTGNAPKRQPSSCSRSSPNSSSSGLSASVTPSFLCSQRDPHRDLLGMLHAPRHQQAPDRPAPTPVRQVVCENSRIAASPTPWKESWV